MRLSISIPIWHHEFNYFSDLNDAFVIDESLGEITTVKELDFEESQVYTLHVQAVDSNGGIDAMSSTVIVTVNVGNINEYEPRFTKSTYTDVIPEDTAIGTSILTVSADDSDSGDDGLVVYSMPDHPYFYLNSKSGEIRLKNALDYETIHKSFNFEVVATDSSMFPESSSSTISISVTDVNDNSPYCNPSVYVVTFSEDTGTGTQIAKLNCNDTDSASNAELSYDIISVNSLQSDGKFSVNSEGSIILESPLDFEAMQSYNIIVGVTDNGVQKLSASATIKLDISDINEFDPVFDEAAYEVNVVENTIGNIPIGQVRATDRDVNNIVQYSIQSNNDYLDIDVKSGDIFVVSSVDFESFPEPKSFEVTVVATDDGDVPGPRSTSVTVTVSIVDTNDGIPFFSQSVYHSSIPETSDADTTVIQIEASDSDGDALTYSLSNASVTFRIQQTGHIVVQVGAVLDYESDTKMYKLIALADDQRDGTGTATIYITITHENEHPPVFTDFSRSVHIPENMEIGQEVMIISATDADEGIDGDISYKIISGSSGKFSIDGTSGQITLTEHVDNEDISSYTLTISASDSGIPQSK